MLWLQDTNGNQTAISGAFEVAITETQGSFDQLSFKFVVDPTNVQDPNYVAVSMILPRTIVVEPVTGKKFRILQPQPESLGDKLLYTVTCTSIAYDLHDMYVETKLKNTQSLTACLDLITSGTNFKYHVTGSFANYSFSEDFGGDFADTLLSNLASDFVFEYYFNNYDIYIKPKIGASGAFLFVENANAAKLTRQEDYSTITTYIKGYGKQNDDGSYTTTADYTSSLASNWGKIWASPYSNNSITNQATLLAKLKSEIHDYPDVQYTMSYTDFINNVQGFKNDTTPGNYGWLRNRFGIDVLVRVQSRTWYPQKQDSGKSGSITFGNKIFDPIFWVNDLSTAQKRNSKLAKELENGLISLKEFFEGLSSSFKIQENTLNQLQLEVEGVQSLGIVADIDSSNSNTSVSFFEKLYNADVKSLVVELSNGNTISNTSNSQITNANTAGLIISGYSHYFLGDPEEANTFLGQLSKNNVSKDKIIVLEVEDDSLSTEKSILNNEILEFFEKLSSAGYSNIAIKSIASWFDSRFSSSDKTYLWKINVDAYTKPEGSDAWEYTNNLKDTEVSASYAYKSIFIGG